MRNNTLFVKILLYFISLLIPIVVISFFSYFQVSQLVKDKASGKLYDNLNSSSHTIGVYMEIIQSAANNVLLDDTVQHHVKPYDLLTDENKLNLPRVMKLLNAYLNNFNYFIDDIFIYTESNEVYSGAGVSEFDTFFTKFSVFDDYDLDFWKQLNKSESFIELLPPSKMTSYLNTKVREVIPIRTSQYVGGRLTTLVTTLYTSALTNVLHNNSIYEETQYLIQDHNGRLVMQSGLWNEAELKEITERFLDGEDFQTMRDIALNGRKYTIGYTQSDTFGWRFYSITPTEVLNESSSIHLLIIWISLALCGIGIVLSLIFSLRLYNPIKNIKEILLSGEALQAGGSMAAKVNEFQLIGQRIHQLQQEHDVATRKLDKYSNEVLGQYFNSIINGHHPSQLDLSLQITEQIGFGQGHYVCCCFLFKFREKFYRDIQEQDRLLIKEKLHSVLGAMMKQYVNAYLVEYEQDFYVGLIQLDSKQDMGLVHQALDKIKVTFEYDMIYCDLVMSVGNLYDDLSDLTKSYSDAVTAIGVKKHASGISVIDASELTIEHNLYYSFLDENRIVNGLKSGDQENIRAKVHELIDRNKAQNVSYLFLGQLLVEMYNTGNRYITEKDLNLYSFVTGDERLALTRKELLPDELEDRIELLLQFYERIINETVYRNDRKTGAIVSLVTAYIEKNYHKDLYLENIADEIGLSTKYLSRLFKDITGTTITDYIGLVRMTKAKELLIRTDLKVNEIADRIGIFSRTTFLRLFRKYEGLSPSEYRNAYRDGKNS